MVIESPAMITLSQKKQFFRGETTILSPRTVTMGIQRPMTQAGLSLGENLEVVSIKPNRDQGSVI